MFELKRNLAPPLVDDVTVSGILLAFALLASAINIFPLIPLSLLTLFLFALGRNLLAAAPLLPRGPAKWFLVYLVLSLVYCQLINVSLLDPDLYRRELKYIFPFAAFMLVSNFDFKWEIDKSLVLVLEGIVILTVLFVFASLIFIEQDLSSLYPYSENMWAHYEKTFLYSGQFLDHSAFGGFLSTLFLILLGIFRWSDFGSRRKLVLALELAILAALLYFARSRAFVLGTAIVAVASTFFYHVHSRVIRSAVIGAVLIGALVGVRSIALNVLQFQDSTQELSSQNSVADYNVLARYILWGVAAYDFAESPIVGVGISRFDDNYAVLMTFPDYKGDLSAVPKDPQYWGTWPFRIETDPFVAHTDQHAHNAYLHVLAEGGLVFFSLAAFMYYSTMRALRRSANATTGVERGLRMGLLYAFFGVLIGSFFGNNLFTIIPMYMLLSLCGYVVSRSYSGGPSILRAAGQLAAPLADAPEKWIRR